MKNGNSGMTDRSVRVRGAQPTVNAQRKQTKMAHEREMRCIVAEIIAKASHAHYRHVIRTSETRRRTH